MKALSASFLLRLAWLFLALAGLVHAERILFIGNSYTSVNKLPEIYQGIITSTGVAEPEMKSITPGGRTLEQHLSDPKTLNLVDEGKWDIVVIQGQSQEAAMSETFDNIRTGFLKGAKGLGERIKTTSPRRRSFSIRPGRDMTTTGMPRKPTSASGKMPRTCSRQIASGINRPPRKSKGLSSRPPETPGR